MFSKIAVHKALIELMEAKLTQMAAIAEDTRKGAVHEENRSEGDKDMRATEQSYIARGQAMRVDDLTEELRRLQHAEPRTYGAEEAVGVYALVTLKNATRTKHYYLTPFGGGNEVTVDGQRIATLAPSSPLGEKLIGMAIGDAIELAGSAWEVQRLC